jgi:hypothetical protein
MDDAFAKLKVTYTGFRSGTSGAIFNGTAGAYYNTATLSTTTEHYSVRIRFNSSGISGSDGPHSNAYAVRCIKKI